MLSGSLLTHSNNWAGVAVSARRKATASGDRRGLSFDAMAMLPFSSFETL
jgi:hypothetical protein